MIMAYKIDSTEIKEIAKENQQSKTIFNALAARQRTRKVTDVRQFYYKLLNEGAKLSKEDVIHTFKRLEDAGAGSLIIGRKNKPDRFEWNYSIKKIASAAVGSQVKKPIKNKKEQYNFNKELRRKRKRLSPDELRTEVSQLLSNVSFKNLTAVIATSINIRDNFSVKLELPLNLTKEDADKISKTIYSLVQERESLPTQDPMFDFTNPEQKNEEKENSKESIQAEQ